MIEGEQHRQRPLSVTFLAGAASGLAVESVLFPLDTLKTRLQASRGLHGSGSFRSLYSGISAVLVGSAPGAAIFFVTYESVKRSLRHLVSPRHESHPLVFISAATLGEVAACSIRVPAEVLKQRMQVLRYQVGLLPAARELYRKEGSLGFYRGFQATLQREIPFACLQYPLYEMLKRTWARRRQADKLEAWRGALCGSLAGGVTGLLTTPLDVLKTRAMLNEASNPSHMNFSNPMQAMRTLMAEGGVPRLFAGALPRTLWISLGGFLFFGAYEGSGELFQRLSSPPEQHK